MSVPTTYLPPDRLGAGDGWTRLETIAGGKWDATFILWEQADRMLADRDGLLAAADRLAALLRPVVGGPHLPDTDEARAALRDLVSAAAKARGEARA